MSEIAEKVNPSTDGQMKDLTSVLVTAMPDHEKFPREQIEYWMKNKRLLAAKVRAVLEGAPRGLGQTTQEVLQSWERFYREILKIKVDFSDIDTPPRFSEFKAIIPVISSISAEEIVGLLTKNFNHEFSLRDFQCNLDELSHLRPEGHYAVLHRGTRMPDLDMQITRQRATEGVVARYTCVHPPVDASSFMNPREYILFAAFNVWMTSGRHSSPWFDYDIAGTNFIGERALPGTAFPQMDAFDRPLAACCHSSNNHECHIEHPCGFENSYGRLVKVLSSLRIA
ncbi:MAG: hypothetical protein A2845_00695 [Candidatus Lloydbacteria bacterium RIFCSPHIGHO2_01_FULL_49_22]|uniref:Uncharacterized protein n=1 Tax=Candidatus Lloydbacteria bacterium RIFCSPHIGHO2_01_FULL_49_22 TaxID=1798658 RepID=A0A1G2CY44_9BACT|nr:MAG: hypothetical protein A2845_00695 [Candidatus Lloydbacteria bacterium RIFCSPHIGHO2_01_FULL_49_22]OGZ09376.1 MAG: hypothetical protein A3C14_05600 [Candidatus Lloydbacteria bacterium RIFCSPHIGHO2_02_FULL_50_18]